VRKQENISIRKLAERFKVGCQELSSKLLKRFEETGDISSIAQGASLPTKLSGEQLVTLVKIIEENNEATLTLKELTELLESKTAIKVSILTMEKLAIY